MGQRSWMSLLMNLGVPLLLLCLTAPPCSAQLTVEAIFDQRGVNGTIRFIQDTPSNDTEVVVDLNGAVEIILYRTLYTALSLV